ncbi:Signal peptidase I [Rickettsiales endosymbiont of Paramecium tredecaurelia]|uniref:signal peptidase I n=1 Tax=Candidatus Sarmatiella mevalonica TaxID=2770581 RepID=UPI001922ACA3|nr:signal peptidase I [Candidatus Sarmatiella mevalonica]MBL3284715.1 Signal peptidase I [Candidatus Sarmatiella mevalonica]
MTIYNSRTNKHREKEIQSFCIIRELRSFLYVLILAMLVRSFLLEIVCVPTGSMKFTILEQDYLLVTKYSYGASRYSLPFNIKLWNGKVHLPFISSDTPQRGEVVVFQPHHKASDKYIKRLIGLPGDKVQIIDDVIYINDVAIERQTDGVINDDSGKVYNKYRETLPNGFSHFAYYAQDVSASVSNWGPEYVPQDSYFFMGDNRYESNDSRLDVGFVPSDHLVAKARFIIFSSTGRLFAEQAQWQDYFYNTIRWFRELRWNRIGDDV